MLIIDTESLWDYNNCSKLLVVSIINIDIRKQIQCIESYDLRNQNDYNKVKELLQKTSNLITWNGEIDVVRLEKEFSIKLNNYDLKKMLEEHTNSNFKLMKLNEVLQYFNIKAINNIKNKDTIHIYKKLRSLLNSEDFNKVDIQILHNKCNEDVYNTYLAYLYCIQ
ncbi:MAG: hypothetical protein KatS3mg003_1071 [Candidatus Nitrosocaldaceae archaeon]|nr:MAG: hypothetical protein KatS3mg003_1071 [Candidatus Nitrosocaldaceae archaeon]